MLLFNRKPGESIQINDDIKLTICKARNQQVRIGIDAPRHITIMREELFRVEQTQELDQDETPDTAVKPQVIIKNKRRKRIILPER